VLSLDRLLAFAATALVVIVIPGPSVLFVIGRAITHGRRAALASVIGNASGVYLQAVGVALGIGAIVERSIHVFTALKLLGAGYLVYLGVQAIRHRRELGVSAPVEAVTIPAARRRFGEGLVVGATNPKGFVLFSAVLPQFVDRAAGSVPIQMMVFGLVAVSIAVVTDSIWAMAAGTARDWFARSPRRGEAMATGGGVVMIILGVRLAFVRRSD
jgi:threonine/homoserine/homoserine lactone efflux protein